MIILLLKRFVCKVIKKLKTTLWSVHNIVGKIRYLLTRHGTELVVVAIRYKETLF